MKPAPTNMTLLARFGKLMPFAQHKYFSAFMDHLCGGLGPHTITDVCRWAAFEAHYTCFRDFLLNSFDDAAWLAEQWKLLNDQNDLLTTLPDGRRILLFAGDDTINKHPFASKMFGTFQHHNHAAHPHEKAYVRGENSVVLGCIAAALSDNPRPFIVDDKPYRPAKQHDPSGESDLEFNTRLGLLETTLEQNIELLPDALSKAPRLILVDSFFAKEPLLEGMNRQKTGLIGCLQKNRVLLELPQTPEGKRGRGRPKKRGDRWDYKTALQSSHATIASTRLYGRVCRVKYMSKIVMLKGYEHPVRVVASQLIDEPKQPVALLVSTWLDLDPLVIISLYASRFSLEEAIKDARLVIGWGSEAARKSEAREKWRRLTWLANSWMGCLARNQPASVRKLIKDPWRKDRHRTTLGEIRLALLVERITGRRILVPFGLASDVDKNCFQPRAARISTSHQPPAKAVHSTLDAA